MLLVLLAAIQSLHCYPLPQDVLASHFNGRGEANSWQVKNVFFSLYCGLLAMTTVLGFAIPKLVARAPASLINLPNKDY